ncbi:extracellular solute-binding protein [Pseudovibrio sp. SPO723]|uniref:extracellular solute-binding protein n=1 Tax=Nesiotobacter zosterae TaxID=392721 RepID=UPI0029C51B80|nr:extracellular solute-binding protein [Pseudovibrio sp. SPO723]MDX5592040.1 extracellular solute-binding protein [Pseudovibrio sp. SPO723]
MMDPIFFDRRQLLMFGAAAAASAMVPTGVLARRGPITNHGLSYFGELKYPEGFEAFDYVNPNAPKGGRIVMTASNWFYNQNPQTFNSFNSFILKGDAPPRMELCFDSLMVRAWDEPDSIYGLVAKSVDVSEDGNTLTFRLRPEARFHDGSHLTAEDVAFSLMTLKEQGHPQIRQVITDMVDAVALAPDRVEVKLAGGHSRLLPLTIATLPLFSKTYYTTYRFDQTTLTPPLSSGPYKVGRHEIGRFVEYVAVEEYWAKDLPVMRGHNNFHVIRMDFYRERQAAFEAFKKGVVTYREEFTARRWATEYNFPAIEEGRVSKRIFPNNLPSGAQGWFINTRREKFKDPLIRRAIGMCFDFEWTNTALFFDLYTRTNSFLENSPMKATGLPSEAELALLEPYRDQLPEEVFGEAVVAPVSNGSGQDRKLLREAQRLLLQAGCEMRDRVLHMPSGEPLTFEVLSNSSSFEGVVLAYIKNLRLLGIEATFRVVDPAQFQSRSNDFDFDLCGRRFGLTPTLGEGARQLWGSDAADTPGSYNMAGIKDPVVDALIENIINAETREEMNTAAKALDRVLRVGYYWVPQWYKPTHTVAMWDMFGMPEQKPDYWFPVETTWWVDLEKAVRIGKVD